MTLRSEIATPAGKRRYVRRLFATIADRYDFITGFLSYGQDRRWKRRLIAIAGLRPSDRLLDLACGTGDIAFAAEPAVAFAVGLDLTHRMLQLARNRAHGVGPATNGGPDGADGARRFSRRLVQADMLALPFRAAQFDIVTTGYGLRNVPDLHEAIREIERVLAPGGQFLSLDFNRPSNALVRATYLGYLTIAGSLLGLALHGDGDTYRYIPESIRNYPGARGVARLLEQHGLTDVRFVPVLLGLMAIHIARKPGHTES